MIKSIQNKGLADGAVRKIFNLVQTSFKSATKKELIIKHPSDYMNKGSKPRTSKPQSDYWTVDEVKHFFKVLDHRQKIIFVLAIYCGIRAKR
jgi:hypothetical protein